MDEMIYGMSDDAFAALVADEVKNRCSDEQRQYLGLPENRDRWYRALQALLANLDGQLAEIQGIEDLERDRFEKLGADGVKLLAKIVEKFDEQKKKITRFRHYVARRADEVGRLIGTDSAVIEERARLVEFYRQAIERHAALTEEADLEATPIDQALWAALDGKWEFGDIDLAALADD